MRIPIILIGLMIVTNTIIAQKLITTYYDWNKIHPHEQYYVNAAGQKNGLYKEYNQQGIVIREYNFLNGLENGLCTDYAMENNQRVIAAKGTFKNGKGSGPYVQFCNEDGYKSKVREGNYLNGKKTGLWTEWWCTEIFDKKYVNQIKSTGYYSDDLRNGVWKDYTETGALTEAIYDKGKKVNATGKFADGKKQGPWTYYYDNGTVQSRGNYTDDNATGEWIFYDEQGKLHIKGIMINGKENGKFHYYSPDDSSKPLYTNEYLNGLPTGEQTTYFDKDWNLTYTKSNLEYYRKVIYDKKGEPIGPFIYYYGTGEKQSQAFVVIRDNTVIDEGRHTEYYKNGQISIEGDFVNGKKMGIWKTYYETGKPKSDMEFNIDGVKINTENLYYPSGTIKEHIYYDKFGRRIGSSKYDESGKEIE